MNSNTCPYDINSTAPVSIDTMSSYSVVEDNDVIDVIHDLAPTDLSKKENIAIALSYFAVGFVSSFICTPLNIYMVNTLNAEPPIQNTIGILQTLPWYARFTLIRCCEPYA